VQVERKIYNTYIIGLYNIAIPKDCQ